MGGSGPGIREVAAGSQEHVKGGIKMIAFILTVLVFFFAVEWFKQDGMPGCLAFVLVFIIMVIVWITTIGRIL